MHGNSNIKKSIKISNQKAFSGCQPRQVFQIKLMPMSPEKILLNWSPRRFWGIWSNRS